MIPRWSPYYFDPAYYPPGYIPWSPDCGTPWSPPTVAVFQAQFFRDFKYAPPDLFNLTGPEVINKYIVSQDIQNALNLALMDFNPQYGTYNTIVFLYLSAHYMVMNIRNSSMGLNSQAKFMLESSSVGGVSIVNNINELFAKDPNFSKYLTTGYGQIYLDMVYPFTVGGGLGIVPGTITSA